MLAGASRARIRAIAARPRTPTSCGTTGVCDGTGACERYSGNAGVVCADEACIGFMRTTTGDLRQRGRLLGRDARSSCTPFQCATRRQDLPDDAARRTPTACRPTAASTAAAARSRSAPPAAPTPSATRRSARRAGAARPPAPGPASRARSPGSEGTCRNVPDGQDPLGQCADEGAATCGLDGQCDGTGACRKYAVTTMCGTDSCSAGAERVGRRCDATGTCAPGHACDRAARTCAARRTARPAARAAPTASTGFSLHRQRLHAEVERHDLHRRAASARPATASRASAATPAARPPAVSVQPDGHRRDVHADAGGRGAHARHAVHGHGRHVLRHRRQVQRRGRVPQLRRGHGVRRRELHRDRRCRRRARATGRGCAGPRPPARAPRISAATDRLQDVVHDHAPPTARRGNTCVTMSCGKIPIGGACPSGLNSDCASNFCVNNVCCNTACTGTCMSCSLAGSVGTCSPIARRRTAAGRVAVPDGGGVDVRQRRHLQRRGRVPQVRQRHVVRGGDAAPARRPHVVARSATARASAPRPRRRPAGSTPATRRRRLPDHLHAPTHRLRRAQHLQRGHLHAEADRHGLHGGERVRLRLLRAGLLLQPGLHRDVQVVRDHRQPRRRAATSPTEPRPRPPRSARRRCRRRCGTDGMCNGAGACRFWATSHAVRGGDLRRVDADAAADLRRRGRLPSGHERRCAIRTCATPRRRPARRPAPPRADCVAPNICVSGSCGKLRGRPAAARWRATATHNFCAQGVCCSTACTGHLRVVRAGGHGRAPARRSRRARIR